MNYMYMSSEHRWPNIEKWKTKKIGERPEGLHFSSLNIFRRFSSLSIGYAIYMIIITYISKSKLK